MGNAGQIGSIAGLVIGAAVAAYFGAPQVGIALASSKSRCRDPLAPDPRLKVEDADLLRVVNPLLGMRFRLGGRNPFFGFDCHGLVAYALKQARGFTFQKNASGQLDLMRSCRQVWQRRPGGMSWLDLMRPYDLVLWHDAEVDADLRGEVAGVDAWWHIALAVNKRAILSAMVDEGVGLYDARRIEQVFRPTLLLRPHLPAPALMLR